MRSFVECRACRLMALSIGVGVAVGLLAVHRGSVYALTGAAVLIAVQGILKDVSLSVVVFLSTMGWASFRVTIGPFSGTLTAADLVVPLGFMCTVFPRLIRGQKLPVDRRVLLYFGYLLIPFSVGFIRFGDTFWWLQHAMGLARGLILSALVYLIMFLGCQRQGFDLSLRRVLVFLSAVEAAMVVFRYVVSDQTVFSGKVGGFATATSAGTRLLLGFSVALMTDAVRKPWKEVYLLITGFAVLASSSRSTWIGLVAIVLYFVPRARVKMRVFVVIMATAIALFGIRSEVVMWRLATAVDFSATSGSLYARLTKVPVALRIFWSSPVVGGGVGAYSDQARRQFGLASDSPHNQYLYLLSDTGIVGFLIFGVVMFVQICSPLRQRERSVWGTSLRAFLLSQVAASLFGEFWLPASALTFQEVSWMLWTAVALVVGNGYGQGDSSETGG